MEDYGDWIWDEAEYNFFMSLGDISKLEYMYDYFNLDDDDIIGEFELEYDDSQPSTTSVDVVLTDTHFLITCDSDEIVKKTVASFKMDGHILMFQQRKGDTYFYEYVGLTPPFSIN
jgi:hypothetical protein